MLNTIRKLFLIISFIFLVSCQVQSEKKEPVNIKSINNNEWTITSKGIGNIELGKSITKTINQLNTIYKTKKSRFNTYPIYENGRKKEIMLVSPIPKTDIIGSIRIYTDKWKTECGLKKGLTIKDINKFYKDFFLEYDNNSGSEYFYKVGEFKTNNKTFKSLTKFHFIGPTSDYLGDYKFNESIGRYDKSTINNEEGTLNFIEIILTK